MIERSENSREASVPQPAEGLELLGEYEGSGFKEKPYLARRADGQVVQLSYLLYLVAEAVDGERDFEEVAERVTEGFGRDVSADNIRYLLDNKLRPLGMAAAADGSSPKLERATPLFMLKYRVGLVPVSVVRAITAIFWPLFLPPVIVTVLASVVAFDLWLFLVHGGLVSAVREAIYQPASFAVLLFLISSIAVALHECGHATACRYGGAKPGVLGVGIYIVWLVFYSDVTDSYRLGKAARIRTDLGGVYLETVLTFVLIAAYLVTGFEPLLVVIVLMQIGLLDEFVPVLRFDGYYIISDITGVPDLFGRIKPILKSMIPGQEPDRRVTELKPWVRVVVTTWVMVVLVMFTVVFTALALHAPMIVATAWDSFLVHSHKLSEAFKAGEVTKALVQLVDILILFIPVVGMGLILTMVGRRLGKAAWGTSVGKPLLRAGFIGVLGIVGGLMLVYWWPDPGQGETVRPVDKPLVQGSGVAPVEAPASQSAPVAGQQEDSGAAAAGPEECVGNEDQCVEELVAQVSPQAEYAGGRIDTEADDTGRDRSILYFVDPVMEPCQYKRLEYSTNGATIHTAIVVGEGSFDKSGDAKCIPD